MNIYAFPLSRADILTGEDWRDRIERMAREARMEISYLAKAAQIEFAPRPEPMSHRTPEEVLRAAMRNAAYIYNQQLGLSQASTLSQLGLAQRQGLFNALGSF